MRFVYRSKSEDNEVSYPFEIPFLDNDWILDRLVAVIKGDEIYENDIVTCYNKETEETEYVLVNREGIVELDCGDYDVTLIHWIPEYYDVKRFCSMYELDEDVKISASRSFTAEEREAFTKSKAKLFTKYEGRTFFE